MNHRTLSCERCSNAELCIWGVEIHQSLQPPTLKPGFWAQPVVELGSFDTHSIWRCASHESCLEGGVCAEGREGHACGLCQAGHHGSPDGPCEACDRNLSPASRRWLLALIVLVLLVPAVVLLHVGLASKEGESVQMSLHLEAIMGSLKQMAKHIQTVSVIGNLSVSWPPVAQAFFQALKQFTVNIPVFLQTGCLSAQTSVGLEMAFKWLMPLAFAATTALAVPFSRLLSWGLRHLSRRLSRRCPRLAKRLPRSERTAMSTADAVRVLLFSLTIFWSTLVSNCLEMITCVPSPNGKFTVNTYPQLQCSLRNPDFVVMAAISLLTVMLYLALPLRFLWHGYIQATRHLASSERAHRGWFHFLFNDFRDGHLLWVLEIMVKDASFVFVPVILPGQGAAQLLLIAALSAAHICLVLQSTPFRDRSNSLLEAWNGATGASLCIYSVGMGYERTLGMEGVEELFHDGVEDPLYQGREKGMLAVQIIAVGVPLLFLLYQLLCALERARALLPRSLRPTSAEDSEKWLQDFLRDTERVPLSTVLRNFDRVDMYHFRRLFEETSATLGHELSTRTTSFLVRVHNEMRKSSTMERNSELAAEKEDEALDPMDEEPETARQAVSGTAFRRGSVASV